MSIFTRVWNYYNFFLNFLIGFLFIFSLVCAFDASLVWSIPFIVAGFICRGSHVWNKILNQEHLRQPISFFLLHEIVHLIFQRLASKCKTNFSSALFHGCSIFCPFQIAFIKRNETNKRHFQYQFLVARNIAESKISLDHTQFNAISLFTISQNRNKMYDACPMPSDLRWIPLPFHIPYTVQLRLQSTRILVQSNIYRSIERAKHPKRIFLLFINKLKHFRKSSVSWCPFYLVNWCMLSHLIRIVSCYTKCFLRAHSAHTLCCIRAFSIRSAVTRKEPNKRRTSWPFRNNQMNVL